MRLSPYGIHPRIFRTDGSRSRGYFKQDMQDAFRRYIPKSEIEALTAETYAAHSPAHHQVSIMNSEI